MDRPLLILDLDETLILGSAAPLERPADFRCGEFHVYERPGVGAFLRACAAAWDLAFWTSSTADYAACVVAALAGDLPVAFTWARDRCIRRFDHELQEPYWVKDLKKVKRRGWSLARVLVVDDTARKLERNYGNLVLVKEYAGDPADGELPLLARYLADLAAAPDLRRIEKRGWRGRRP